MADATLRRMTVICGRPVTLPFRHAEDETKLERARRIYGRPFGKENWPTGQGARYWTAERVGQLAVLNDAHRKARAK